jgi:hypothetical protein
MLTVAHKQAYVVEIFASNKIALNMLAGKHLLWAGQTKAPLPAVMENEAKSSKRSQPHAELNRILQSWIAEEEVKAPAVSRGPDVTLWTEAELAQGLKVRPRNYPGRTRPKKHR